MHPPWSICAWLQEFWWHNQSHLRAVCVLQNCVCLKLPVLQVPTGCHNKAWCSFVRGLFRLAPLHPVAVHLRCTCISPVLFLSCDDVNAVAVMAVPAACSCLLDPASIACRNCGARAWLSNVRPLYSLAACAARYLGGVIQGLFFAVGAPSALIVGYLCDKLNRRNLLFIVVILGGPVRPASCLSSLFPHQA